MRERIEKLIKLISSGRYDSEQTHVDYEALLEEFINSFSEQDDINVELMQHLISLPKDFWYA